VPNGVGENQTKRKLAAGELVLCMGVNQMRTPSIAMIAAAFGFGRDLHRPRAQPDLARDGCGDLRGGTRDRHHADRSSELTRPPGRHADPRLWRVRGNGPACQHGGRGSRGAR